MTLAILLWLNFYRPQRSCGKVMFFTRVFDSVHRGVWPTHPNRCTPPSWADTPRQAGTPPLGRHPPPGTATAADGTHPTGMYSCLIGQASTSKTTLQPQVIRYDTSLDTGVPNQLMLCVSERYGISIKACIISDQLGLKPIFGATRLVY